MDQLTLLDLSFRLPALTIMLVWIGVLVFKAERSEAKIVFIALLCSSIASSLHTMPEHVFIPAWLYSCALIFAIPGLGLQWYIGRLILDDGFERNTIFWAIIITTCTLKSGWSLSEFGIDYPFYEFRFYLWYSISLGLLLHIVWIAVTGLKTDMSNARRRLRFMIVLLAAVIGIGSQAFELFSKSAEAEAIFVQVSQLIILSVAFFMLIEFSVEPFLPSRSHSEKATYARTKNRTSDVQRLEVLMETQQPYLDPELSFDRLASHLGMPKHRLRAAIHEGLQHRNFANYINGLRVSYAKDRLSSFASGEPSILDIAMDAGFGSLSTFNRAFKQCEKVSPTEYRKHHLREQAGLNSSETGSTGP